MRGVYRTILWMAAAFFFAFGTCNCERKSPKPSDYQTEEVSCEAPEPNIPPKKAQAYRVEELNKNEYRIFFGDPAPRFYPITGIFSSPEGEAGIEAEFFAFAHDDEGINAGINEMRLYEDGNSVHSFHLLSGYDNKQARLQTTIRHTEKGEHTYFAVAVDRGGNRTPSKAITLSFSGKPLDLPPKVSSFFVTDDGELMVNAHDEGDNRGIKTITIFEDCVPFYTMPGMKHNEYLRTPLPARTGRHEYVAEVVDKGGNVTRSKTLTLEFVE
jgi:hypothetical protein